MTERAYQLAQMAAQLLRDRRLFDLPPNDQEAAIAEAVAMADRIMTVVEAQEE